MHIKNIVIVEDERVTALLLQQSLEDLGFHVLEVFSNGEEAVEAIDDLDVDLILMDIFLEGKLDGIEASRVISKKSIVPIIYLTANSDKATLDRAKLTTPFGYLLKPFHENDLRVTLEMASYKFELDKKLRDSERRFRSLVQNSSDFITTLSEDDKITYNSPAFSDLFSVNSDQTIGESFLDYVFKEDQSTVIENIRRLKEMPANSSIRLTYRMINRIEDKVFPVESTVSNRFEDSAIKALVLNTRDMSENFRYKQNLEQALYQKEVLLKEVYHRVKNNLAMVEGLLFLQKNIIEDEEYKKIFDKCEKRIHSMSLVHKNLYQTEDLDEIDFDNYLSELIYHLAGSYDYSEKVEIDIDLINVSFDLSKSIPLGLIANECITNSFKYAFYNQRGGKLKIQLFKDEHEKYIFRISDDGPGYDMKLAQSGRKTLGLNLIEMFASDLRGQASFYNKNGFTTEIKF
ncbi:MAG: response regulator [Cyclobacteriaceae bacterium]|nr:response regulator [Cyclobacteriaceae bacterium]